MISAGASGVIKVELVFADSYYYGFSHVATGHVGCSHVVREIGNILAVLAKNTTLITASLRSAVIKQFHYPVLGILMSRWMRMKEPLRCPT